MTPHDHAPNVPAPGADTVRPAPAVYKRSGSEKRRRNHKTDIRWDDHEYALLLEKSQDAGVKPNGYLRALVIGTPGPRAQRTPHVHADAIARATAALNKLGSNLNQIAHVLNAGGALGMAQQYLSLLAETRLTLRAIREAVGRKDRDDDHQGKPAQ